jgi:hypothetical protein
MKKSILSFGSMIMLLLIVFSCSKEQENVTLPDEGVNLRGEVNKEKKEADERGTYNVTHLLNYLHGYIESQVSNEFKYYENIPERKEANWFFENFKNHLNAEREADKWVLDKIKSGEILIFGTTAKNVKVTALIFPEGLDIHEEFDGKKGIFFDGNTAEECMMRWGSWGQQWGNNCFCHMYYACDAWNDCFFCWNDDQDFNLEDLIDFDPWIINDYDFEKYGSVPVSEINIGDPVLQLIRK